MIGRLAILAVLLAGPATAANRSLTMAGIADDIDPRVLDDFSAVTGIAVFYDGYDTPALVEARVQTGMSGYDLAILSGPAVQRQAAGLQKIDKARVPGLAGLWPAVVSWQVVFDPGQAYGVPYQWYTTGIAFDVARARERLGEAGVTSWDVLFRLETLKKFTDCGVDVLDSAEDMMPVALAALKLNPAGTSAENVRRAMDFLARLRSQVGKFTAADFTGALVNGDACLAVGWTGEALQARSRAKASKGGPEIGYAIPREGTLASVEMLAIPKDAPHAADAHLLIDFLLKPENAARNSIRTGLASSVLAAKAFLPPEIAGDAGVYPDEAQMKRLYAAPAPDAATQKLLAREWQRVKTGK